MFSGLVWTMEVGVWFGSWSPDLHWTDQSELINKFFIVQWSVGEGEMLDHLTSYEALKSGAMPHLETSH